MDSTKADEGTSTSNTQHPNISKGIVQSLQKVWIDHEFEDFNVSVDGDTFSCHSFILASCSEFFCGLLRSNMREKKEMKVELNNISSSAFQLILNSLYTGCDFVTKENVLEVWSAVHQLQIQFLIEHCEDFVINNLSLDTVELYKEHAEYLQSEKVKDYIFKFILSHFDKLMQKDILVRLDFDYLVKLIKSDELKVDSEDFVLFLILDWVNSGHVWTNKANSIKALKVNEDIVLNTEPEVDSVRSLREPSREIFPANFNLNCIPEDNQVDSKNQDYSNDRKPLLIHLLKASRYYLASEACIVKLYKDKLIQSDTLVKDLLFEAFNFKFCGYWHSSCPTPAIHRDCSNIEHVGVFCDEREIIAIIFKQEKYIHIKKLPKDLDATITIFNGELYVCLLEIAPTQVYVLETNTWKRVTEITHAVQVFLSHEMYIYAIDAVGKKITRFNPETSTVNLETFSHEIENLTYVLGFYNNLVAFSSEVNNGIEETAVHSWNTETRVMTKHDNLKLFPQNLQSFRDDVNTYILDVYGNLLKLVNVENIGFSFVAKLWTEKYNIKGAVFFGETLYLLDGCPDVIEVVQRLEGVFTSRSIWEVGEKTSNILHYTIPKIKTAAS